MEETTVVPAPYIDRPVTLHCSGDWGTATLTRICGWLSSQVVSHSAPGSRVATWTGHGIGDLVTGAVDVAVGTPTCTIPMECSGRWPGSTPSPNLRALGTIPQWDRLVFAVRPEVGASSFEELRARRQPLRIATGARQGKIGVGARVLLEGVGMGEDVLHEWGGRVDYNPDAPSNRAKRFWMDAFLEPLYRSEVDAVIMEAIMLPHWHAAVEELGLQLPSLDAEAVGRIDDAAGWPAATLPASYFPGQDHEVTALEFSDFVVLCRDDLSDDVAYLLAWALGETFWILERQYEHIPPERSPVTYPLDRASIGTTVLPLHPAAQRYFDQAS